MWNFNKQEFFEKLFLTSPCENGRRKGKKSRFSRNLEYNIWGNGIVQNDAAPGGTASGKEKMVDEERKVLTREGGCGSISHALSKRCIPNHARVVELVDSLASGASARKGVRVRLPPRAPRRSKVRFAPTSFLSEAKKTSSARSLVPPSQLRPAPLGSQLVGCLAGGIFSIKKYRF